jgi:hypothetical protein
MCTQVGKEYPDVELSHMYIDNAAMQLLRNPKYFDVIVTGELSSVLLLLPLTRHSHNCVGSRDRHVYIIDTAHAPTTRAVCQTK